MGSPLCTVVDAAINNGGHGGNNTDDKSKNNDNITDDDLPTTSLRGNFLAIQFLADLVLGKRLQLA